jgi:hypothetical protein
MEKRIHLNACVTGTAFLLIGTFTVAQSASRGRTVKPRDASSGQASGLRQRKDGAISHADYQRTANQRKGETSGINAGSNAAAHGSAGSESPMEARAGENPLYEQSGNSGTNPMHESKDRLKTNAGASDSLPDPKTVAGASSKHVAAVKYQNRTSAGPQPNKPSSKEKFKQDFGQVQASKR